MLTVGQTLPDFTLLNQDEKPVSLSDYRGKKVIIFAFPKANTPGCTAQACTFRDNLPNIEAENAIVLGLSPDSPKSLKSWKESQRLQYDLLSDSEHTVLESLGAWGVSVLSLVKIPMATRSYWVIDENGVLIDFKVGIGPKESVEAALKALNA
jgi:peroxiredoxin Q/BCP